MLTRSFRIVLLIAFALTLAAAGCNTVPLGDPEKSTSDASLAGWWQTETAGTLVHIQVYDKRTYIVTLYTYEDNAGMIKPSFKFANKAWTTRVGEVDVMTFQIINPEWEMQDKENAAAKYSYYTIRKLADGRLETQGMNSDFLKDAKTPQELEKK